MPTQCPRIILHCLLEKKSALFGKWHMDCQFYGKKSYSRVAYGRFQSSGPHSRNRNAVVCEGDLSRHLRCSPLNITATSKIINDLKCLAICFDSITERRVHTSKSADEHMEELFVWTTWRERRFWRLKFVMGGMEHHARSFWNNISHQPPWRSLSYSALWAHVRSPVATAWVRLLGLPKLEHRDGYSHGLWFIKSVLVDGSLSVSEWSHQPPK